MIEENNVELSLSEFFNKRFPQAEVNNSNRFSFYNSSNEEYEAIKNGVGIRNISFKSFIALAGKDVLDFLHRVSTNDVLNLNVNQNVNTIFTNEKGRIIDRTKLIRFEDKFLLIGNYDAQAKLYRWIERYIITEDIKLFNASGNYVLLEILGPQTNSYLTLICGKEIDKLNERNLIEVNYNDMVFYIFKYKDVNDIIKYWMLGEKTIAEKLIDNLLSQNSIFDIKMIGEDAYNLFRVEHCIPEYPNELNDLFNPHEINLISEISLSKGCYIGQEVIARLDTYDKVQRLLTLVTCDSNIDIHEPLPILDTNNNEVGYLTSFVKSEQLNKYIGLALLKKSYSDKNTELIVRNGQNDYNLKIMNLPAQK